LAFPDRSCPTLAAPLLPGCVSANWTVTTELPLERLWRDRHQLGLYSANTAGTTAAAGFGVAVVSEPLQKIPAGGVIFRALSPEDRAWMPVGAAWKPLETRFREQLVSEIQTEDIREWLSGLPLATKTLKHRGYAGQVFNLAIDYGYLPANPVTKIKRFNERSTEDDEISILSGDETEQLLRAADPAVIPFLTLSFFCGVRVATLERLSWADVKFEERRVIVPRYKGKNRVAG
jgi:hypothetical protein